MFAREFEVVDAVLWEMDGRVERLIITEINKRVGNASEKQA